MTFLAPVLVCVILFAALLYILRAKRRGRRCIGCPYAGACSRSCCDKSCSADADPDENTAEKDM